MSPQSPLHTRHILLADDDADDCLLFKDVLDELDFPIELSTVSNGEDLIQKLNEAMLLPDLLFLDLNMPKKNGFDCLKEIKQNKKLKLLPVIILSTSFEEGSLNRLFKNGAQNYICKPNEFSHLVKVIRHALTVSLQLKNAQPTREEFLLSPESCLNESN